jgi:MFS transporter, YNFM family, putative membrane transport protein
LGRAVLLLSLAAFASAASLRATDPLLPLIAAEYAVSTGAASAAITAFAVSYGLLQIVYGPLGDRFGRYRTIAGACLASAFGSAACAAAPGLDALVMARLASGATIGALIPLALAWIGDSFAYEDRQAVLARFMMGQMLGIAFGTAIAGWLGESFGWRAPFVVFAALFIVISALLALEMRRNPAAARRATSLSFAQSVRRMPRVLRTGSALLGVVFGEGLLIFGAFAFVALSFQERYGLGPGLAGTLLTAYAAGGLLYAALAWRAISSFGEPGLVAVGGAALTLGYAGLAFSPWPAMATLCVAAVGAGYYMLHTTLQTRATRVPAEDRGSAIALFATGLFLGQAAGVWIAARIVDAGGVTPVFACAALGLAVLSVLVRWRLFPRARQ